MCHVSSAIQRVACHFGSCFGSLTVAFQPTRARICGPRRGLSGCRPRSLLLNTYNAHSHLVYFFSLLQNLLIRVQLGRVRWQQGTVHWVIILYCNRRNIVLGCIHSPPSDRQDLGLHDLQLTNVLHAFSAVGRVYHEGVYFPSSSRVQPQSRGSGSSWTGCKHWLQHWACMDVLSECCFEASAIGGSSRSGSVVFPSSSS